MIKTPEENLQQVLERELADLKTDNAERLCTILHGLYACMKDLDTRLQILEEKLGAASDDGR